MTVLIIDNYDSFVFNVVRYCEELGEDVRVVRNDAISLDEIGLMAPTAIVISPGPCSPVQAGICMEAIAAFSGRIPILGICLGHQCIGAAFGMRTGRARVPMHGRASLIEHDGAGLFSGLPNPLKVGRYHSLIVEPLPGAKTPLRVSARSSDGEIMGLFHEDHPTMGVQFHPESILSEGGHDLLRNFFVIARSWLGC